MTTRRCAGGGFTLVELLLALALTGLIMVALYSGLRVGTRASDAAETRAAMTEDQRAVAGFISRHVSRTYPLVWLDQAQQQLVFRGASRSLIFTADSPVRGEPGGLYIGAIELVSGGRLIFTYWRAEPDLAGPLVAPEHARRTVMLNRVQDVRFSYYGKSRRVTAWHDTWNDDERLPARVRLIIKTARHGPWPVLVIPIHAEPDTGEPQLLMQPPESAEESGADLDPGEGGDEDPEDF
ncbi:MAG: prepilin-type N-terminal cleavage/methylation domain-containing protein [Gammaproteobacteria bacterium]